MTSPPARISAVPISRLNQGLEALGEENTLSTVPPFTDTLVTPTQMHSTPKMIRTTPSAMRLLSSMSFYQRSVARG